ncbi:hypothetical protein NKI50_30090 [Mesorhizobium sp. M0563]|uniref:hypothetical protein n=1 Tax=Mesorhizobium sp. M0563 TaxID=2956959 RepID=UPI00333BB447
MTGSVIAQPLIVNIAAIATQAFRIIATPQDVRNDLYTETPGTQSMATGIALLAMWATDANAARPVPRWLVVVVVYGINLGLGIAALIVFLRMLGSGGLTDWLIPAWVAGSCLAGAVCMLESSGKALKGTRP